MICKTNKKVRLAKQLVLYLFLSYFWVKFPGWNDGGWKGGCVYGMRLVRKRCGRYHHFYKQRGTICKGISWDYRNGVHNIDDAILQVVLILNAWQSIKMSAVHGIHNQFFRGTIK